MLGFIGIEVQFTLFLVVDKVGIRRKNLIQLFLSLGNDKLASAQSKGRLGELKNVLVPVLAWSVYDYTCINRVLIW